MNADYQDLNWILKILPILKISLPTEKPNSYFAISISSIS